MIISYADSCLTKLSAEWNRGKGLGFSRREAGIQKQPRLGEGGRVGWWGSETQPQTLTQESKFYLVSDAVGVAKCPGQVLTDDTSVQPAR